jgi:lipoprotein-anchoring transpeptidase ErfK/SrfK
MRGAAVLAFVVAFAASVATGLAWAALGAAQQEFQLVVHRRSLRAVLWRAGRVVFRAPVGVGESRWPTPSGEFYIREKLTSFGDPFYGPVAFGTSARSPVLTDWPGGGFVGIHGTDQPELIPGRVSHGCIRMRNADILRLARLMPLGTPLTVR